MDLFELTSESESVTKEYSGIIASPLSINLESLHIRASKRIFLSMGFDLNEQVKDEKFLNLMKINTSLANLVVIDNPNLEEKLRESLNYTGDLFVLPYGCAINEFAHIKGPNKRILGTNRSMSEVHNNKLILEAISLLQPEKYGKFIFLSHGPKKEEFLEKNRNTLEKISYEAIPGGNEQAIKNFLRRIDIFISASKSDGSSVSLLEAMAASKVCIVTDTPTNRYWIEDGVNGFCFNNNSANDLLDKIEGALSMTSLAKQKMTTYAQKKVAKEANWEENSRRFNELLASL